MIRLACSVALLLLATQAAAQSGSDSSAYVAVKAGAGVEQSEDDLSGGMAAGGLAAGITLSPDWAGEVELWVPGFIREGRDGRHRDVLVSVSAVRRMDGKDHTRPYWLVGLSVSRTESDVTTCLADVESPPPFAGMTTTIVDCSEAVVRERRREHHYSSSTFALVGAGLELRISRRIRLAPEVRAHVAFGSIIVRGAVSLLWTF